MDLNHVFLAIFMLENDMQVLVVAAKNWKVELPQNSRDLYEIRGSESASQGELIRHSKQFR